MKILFTFENTLPSKEADAEVFTTTASYLAPLLDRSWLHVPGNGPEGALRAYAPARPAVLRHLCCGLTMVGRHAFREADLVYTRNLWVASMALLFGQRVVFDHYRPWPDQIPPLQPLIRRLMRHRRFLLNICHSDYTRGKYLDVGVPAAKLISVRNGFEPRRLQPVLSIEAAKRRIGVAVSQRTVVYAGRLNGKKGLDLLLAAAGRLPDVVFILVGSVGSGPIEALARAAANIMLVPWQPPETLAPYLFAADVLVIPPSTRPLAEFGSTVLPLKLFLYMASGRPILAGATPDVQEVLRHRENAFLCRPDSPDALVEGIEILIADGDLAGCLAATALADSRGLTWEARAHAIMTAIEARGRSAAHSRDGRSRAQRRTWLRQSGRWLLHLIRTRSIVLPPNGGAPDGGPPNGMRSRAERA